MRCRGHIANNEFLSTPSARRATHYRGPEGQPSHDFYPRPLRGGRLLGRQPCFDAAGFLSTPSARRATFLLFALKFCAGISIHALCEEGDTAHRLRAAHNKNFYPRPLRGGRPAPHKGAAPTPNFYPRPLRGGRLAIDLDLQVDACISIHALCEEGDSKNRDKISIFKQIIQHSARI